MQETLVSVDETHTVIEDSLSVPKPMDEITQMSALDFELKVGDTISWLKEGHPQEGMITGEAFDHFEGRAITLKQGEWTLIRTLASLRTNQVQLIMRRPNG